MRPRLIAFITMFVLLAPYSNPSIAKSPAPGNSFNGSFRVQNRENYFISCSIKIYPFLGMSGPIRTIPAVQIAPYDSLYVYMPDQTSQIGPGAYSIMADCDGRAVALMNFGNDTSGASYNGIAQTSSSWFVPTLYNGFYGYYSNIYVKNISSSVASVTVDYYKKGSSTRVATETRSIFPYSVAVYYQEGFDVLDSQFEYTAKIINASGTIVTYANIYNYVDQMYSYHAFSSGATKMYAPIVMNNFHGFNTNIVVQNLGTVGNNIRVRYSSGHEEYAYLPRNSVHSFYTPASGVPPGNTMYSATIESTNSPPIPLIAVVNQSNAYRRAATYNCFASGSWKVHVPMVMKRAWDYNSSVTCQNIDVVPTQMTISYSGVDPTTTSPSIGAGASHVFYQATDPALGGYPSYFGSATITASKNIICVVNQDRNEGFYETMYMDNLYSYSGMNQ